MAEPFKEFLNAAAVGRLGADMARGHPAFDREGFLTAAVDGLDKLELKDRVRHVAAVLRRFLHPDWPTAIAHVRDVLPTLHRVDGSAGIVFWPLCHLIEAYGVHDFDTSVPALRELTRHATAEFAIRPFIERYPERTMAVLKSWTSDPDPHVRRLVSEGTRPRLPWASRLPALAEGPDFLERLVDDTEPTVRRSVANHLNDLSKDHPELAVALAERWLSNPTPGRSWIVRHGLRSLIKAGHAGALALIGFSETVLEAVALEVAPATVPMGGTVTFKLTFLSASPETQNLLIDYAIHHQKKNGTLSSKVFKWTTQEAGPRERLTLQRSHSFRAITTRRYYPGEHRIEVLVNGNAVAVKSFTLGSAAPMEAGPGPRPADG